MMNPVRKMTTTRNKTCILIPARLRSTRLPKKLLLGLYGKSMIRTVFDKCESFGYDTLVVTDSKDIAERIPTENVFMTENIVSCTLMSQ